MRPFSALFSLVFVACSSPGTPPPNTAERQPSGPLPAETTAAAAEAPVRGCACRLKLSPQRGTAAPNSSLGSSLPSPPFDLERRSTCTAPLCRFDQWLPDAAFARTIRQGVPSPGALWLETIAWESTLVLPASSALESFAVVLEGEVAYGAGERAPAPDAPRLGPWSVLRAPSVGYSLTARGGKASVLIVMLSRSGSLDEAIARGRAQNAPPPEAIDLEVQSLGSVPPSRAAEGARLARVTTSAARPSLSLVQLAPHGALPEVTHPKEWEHVAILRGSGELMVDGARYPVRAGDVFHIPEGARHGFRGGGDELVAITVSSPGGPEQRFLEAAAPASP